MTERPNYNRVLGLFMRYIPAIQNGKLVLVVGPSDGLFCARNCL